MRITTLSVFSEGFKTNEKAITKSKATKTKSTRFIMVNFKWFCVTLNNLYKIMNNYIFSKLLFEKTIIVQKINSKVDQYLNLRSVVLQKM